MNFHFQQHITNLKRLKNFASAFKRYAFWWVCFVLMLFSYFDGWGQINVSYTFGSSATTTNNEGWTGSMSSNFNNPCVIGNYALRANYWSGNASGITTSPNLGTSNGGNVTLSYKYKIMDYGTPPSVAVSGNWGNFKWQYSTNNTTWTDIPGSSIDQNNDANNTSCNLITLSAFAFPSTTTPYIRIVVTRTSGDWFLWIDDVTISQTVACSNLTSAGTISADQTICSGGDPSAFSSTEGASGGSGGSISYQWESSTNGTVYTDIPGATGATYDPPSGLSVTTYYRRKAKRCTGSWEVTSSALTITVNNSPSAVSASVTTSSICAGSTLSLIGAATGNTSWSWLGPNNFSSASQSPSISSATTAASGTYFLTAQNSCGTGSGLFDDFSDNNFTSNPVWTPEGTYTYTAASGVLQPTSNTTDERITTPSTQTYGSWKFDFQLAANGNSADVVRFHFISNSSTLNTSSGYFLRASGLGTNGIQIFRFDAGTPVALGSFTYTPSLISRTLLVTRSTNNVFRVYLDGTLVITTTADGTYTTSSFAGVWTSGNNGSTNHIVDNIVCSSTLVDVTVNPSVATPIFALGTVSTRCIAAGTVSYTATSTGSTGITYSLDAASIAGGVTINSATGVVTYPLAWSGITVITASATGCGGPIMATHTVTTLAAAVRDAPTGPQCSGTQLNFSATSVAGVVYAWTVAPPTGLTASPTTGSSNTFSTTLTNSTTADIVGGSAYISVTQTSNGVTCTTTFNPTIRANPVATVSSPTLTVCGSFTSGSLGGNTPPTGTGVWTYVSGVTGTINTPSSPSSTFTASGYGTTVLRWTVSNSPCADASADVSVTFSPSIGFANTSFPSSETICNGNSFDVYGQVYISGVTEAGGQGTGVTAQLGWSTTNTNPSTWTNWTSAVFNSQQGNNDQFFAQLTGLASGTYYYAFRYAINGCTYTYGGTSGIWSNNNGVLAVNDCFGTYASAPNLTSCNTIVSAQGAYYNTSGSGSNLINSNGNNFQGYNFGSYFQNSAGLVLKGAEIKTFKNNTGNVCSARMYYRVYSGTPSGVFSSVNLPFYDNCSGGAFPTGGSCNTGDQKWRDVIQNIDLTQYPAGNYSLEIYYEITGSHLSTSGCGTTLVLNNNGSNYISNFTILSAPTASNTGPYCEGTGTVTLSSSSGGSSYSWIGPNSFSISGQNPTNGNPSVTNSGTYTVTVNVGGCQQSASTNVVVNSLPSVIASNNGPICAGQTLNLSSTSGFNAYSWTGPTFTSTTQNPTISNFQLTNEGSYTVTVTDANNCQASASTSVSLTTTPTASNNGPVCVGGSLSLNTPISATSYSWSGPNSFTSTLQNPSVSSSATAVMAGTYTVSIIGSCATINGVVDNFSDGNFTGNPVWSVTSGGWQIYNISNSQYLYGNNSSITDIITTPSTQAYGTWNFDYSFQTTANTTNQIIRFFTSASSTALQTTNGYYVYVDGGGNIFLKKLTGGTASNLISSSWTANTVWHSVKVIRDFDNTFKLYLDGVLKGTSSSDNTFTTSSYVGLWNTGDIASDNHRIDNISCVPAATATTIVAVNSPPSTSNAGSFQTICQGTSATLSANNPTSGTGAWSITSGPNTSTTQFGNTGVYNTTFTPTTTGTYVLTWTISNSPCSPSSSNVTIIAITNTPCSCSNYPLNYANQTADNDITNVTVGTLNNTSACGANPGLNSVPFKYSNYTQSVSSTTLTQGESVNFSLTSSICGGTDNQNNFLIYIDFNQNGSFAEANEKVYSQIASGPTSFITNGQTVTGNFIIPISAMAGITRMRIVNTTGSFNSTNYAETNYTLGENEDYCVTIIPCTAPSILAQPAGFTQCFNGTQTLSISASGTSLSYQWFSNTSASTSGGTSLGSANGAQTATYTPPSTSEGTTYYYCVVTESNACSTTSNVVSITVLPQLNPGTVSGVPHLVIYQVYGAGGNSGATYNRDFVVLYNPTENAIALNSYSIQYAATGGTSWTSTGALSGNITAGGYYLIQMTLVGTNGVAIPTPNFTTSTAIDMASANGKIALLNTISTLGSISCPTSNIVDFVGYGTANCSEGSSAVGALSNTNWATRKQNGCQDTDVNSADFTVGNTTAPKNSASATNTCSNSNNSTIFTETICAGQNASSMTVTGVSGGNGSYSYQWYSQAGNVACPSGSSIVGWTPIDGATSPTYTPTSVTATRTYACYVTFTGANNCGGAWSTNCRVVNVNPAPIISGMLTTACSGVQFSATPVNGTDGTVPVGTTYSWSAPNATGITGAASGASVSSIFGTLTNTTTSPVDIQYSITATTGSCSSSYTLTVTVNPTPVVDNGSISVCSPSSFTYAPSGTTIPSNITYSWSSPSGVNFTGGQSGTNSSNISGTLILSSGSTTTALYTITPSSGTCNGSTFTLTVNISNCLPPTPFTTCNLIVYKIGEGVSSLNTSAFPVSIDEIDPSGQPVQSVSNLFVGSNLLTQSGGNTSVGFLNSYNGFLAVPGYNAALGTGNVVSTNTKVTNIIDASQSINNRYLNTTVSPIPFNNSTYRSAVPTSATTFYCSGDGSGTTTGGIWYYNGTNFTQIYNTIFNVRNIEIFNGNLYFTTGSGLNRGLYQVGTGLPTTSGQSATLIVSNGLTDSSPYDFSISPDGCTIYLTDDGNGNSALSGIYKWKNINGAWSSTYKYNANARGLVVDYSPSTPIIYSTVASSNSVVSTQIISIKDDIISTNPSFVSNWSSPITVSPNFAYAGIDFTPNSTVVATNPISNQPVASASLCNTQTQSISVTASGTNTYQWYSNSVNSICGATPISGATGSSYTPPVATSSGTTYYFVKVATNCYNIFYSNIAAVITTINPLPNASNNSPFCSNQNNTLILSTPNLTGATFSWTGPNSFSSNAQNPTVTTNATSVHAGTYNLVTTVNGCNSPSGSTAVTINQAPSIDSISPP